jgi:hypothetical protein
MAQSREKVLRLTAPSHKFKKNLEHLRRAKESSGKMLEIIHDTT